MEFNRAEPTCYGTNFPYACSGLQNGASSYIVLRKMRLKYARGLIRFSSCARLSKWLTCVPIKDSDQPEYPCSLIKFLDGHSIGTCSQDVQIAYNLCCRHMPTCTLCWTLTPVVAIRHRKTLQVSGMMSVS